jgi:signal transduction histidine kinase
MAAEKEHDHRPMTLEPRSTVAPADSPRALPRLMALATASRGVELRRVLEQQLEVLVELEPIRAAAVYLPAADPHPALVVTCAAGSGRVSGYTESAGLLGDTVERGTPGADEFSVALAGLPGASLRLIADSVDDLHGGELTDLAVEAASIVALTVRTLRAESEVRMSVDRTVQLEKLATIGQTAASIVHEINNPLTAIIAYTDYLQKRMQVRDPSDTDVDRLHRIAEAAGRIQRFCRDLTDYSRPGARLRAPVDLHDVIDRALGFCMHGLRGADITVDRSYRDIPMIQGTDTQLTQVFVNLITNAWDAMPGGGTLSIRTAQDDSFVRIEVADEGGGIPRDVLPRIFESYFTTKARGRGVGLGLSIVKQIIADHGGRVTAAVRDPQGTVFSIELPIGMGE